MKALLSHSTLENNLYEVQVTGSKSESNRLLIIQALFPNLRIENLSESDDTRYLQKALSSDESIIDIHHAGTAMRFLTAFFACQTGKEVLLTGSQRMQERPIGILVEALKSIGADITFDKIEGFPPLLIKGKELSKNKVCIQADTSSQYISALMLIGASFPQGLEIELIGTPTSIPYIKMTLALLARLGIIGQFEGNRISIPHCDRLGVKHITVESDWSSASYFYSIAALSEGVKIQLKSYRKQSLQGDAALVKIFKSFGVSTEFNEEKQSILLSKDSNFELPEAIDLDLVDTPDIAQTIAVVCFGLGISCNIKGLHTLKIKETDRLLALRNELQKLGANIRVTNNSLHMDSSHEMKENITIETYNDHRMAMAFAPLSQKVPLQIQDCMVVSKSFPSFWEDLRALGFLFKLQ